MNTLKQIFANRAERVLLIIFVIMVTWLVIINLLGMRGTIYNYLYSPFLAILCGYSGLVGMYRAQQWGGYKSLVGKSVFFYSLGMFGWSLGSIVWTYYNFVLQVELPYPSWAEVGYLQVYLWWGLGYVLLSLITSVKTENSRPVDRIIYFMAPAFMAFVTYYFIFVQLHGNSFDGNFLKTFVDIAYPMGQVAILAIVIFSSGSQLNYLGQRLKVPISILIAGIVINYFSDFYFSYITTAGGYYTAGLSDLIYTISLSVMALGLSNLHPRLLEDK